jgi:hypothetical protein
MKRRVFPRWVMRWGTPSAIPRPRRAVSPSDSSWIFGRGAMWIRSARRDLGFVWDLVWDLGT